MTDRDIFEKETGIDIGSCINQDGIDPVVYKYIEWLEKRSEWVSVEDRLPEERGYYLCYGYDRNNKREFKVLFLISTKDGFGDDEYCMKPTHWRPLPTPPDEAKRGRG